MDFDSVELKDSISTADPVIDQMIFSPLFDHGEFQDTISSHIIEGIILIFLW